MLPQFAPRPNLRTPSMTVIQASIVSAFATASALLAPLSQAQTVIDPARAAAPTQRDVTADAALRAQQSAASARLGQDVNFMTDTGSEDDLGAQLILKRNEETEPFMVWLDSSGFWTDNAANVKEGNIEDFFYVGGVNLAWQQSLGGRFYGDVYAGQHWYRYDELRELDYESGEVSAGFLIALPELMNSIFHVHYYYQRVTQDIGEDPIYETHNIRVGINKNFVINRLSGISVSLLSSLAMAADPKELQRHEHSFSLGYNLKLSSHWSAGLFYRLAYYDYFNLEGRHDWYHNFGTALTWRPCPNFELSLGYNFTLNESNFDVFSYQAHLAGPSVVMSYKF